MRVVVRVQQLWQRVLDQALQRSVQGGSCEDDGSAKEILFVRGQATPDISAVRLALLSDRLKVFENGSDGVIRARKKPLSGLRPRFSASGGKGLEFTAGAYYPCPVPPRSSVGDNLLWSSQSA